nr:hypothetical protein CFP56_65929 [Quercus suber]
MLVPKLASVLVQHEKLYDLCSRPGFSSSSLCNTPAQAHFSICISTDSRRDFTETFNVLVGPEKKKFVLCKDLFMARSDYFAAACSGRWRQDDADIELLADDPDTFNNYVASIYSSDIIVEINIDNAYETMIKTYFLADRLGDRENSNNIISTMIRWELENKCFQKVKWCNTKNYMISVPGLVFHHRPCAILLHRLTFRFASRFAAGRNHHFSQPWRIRTRSPRPK